MASDWLSQKGRQYLHQLTVEIPNRRTGSLGNRMATDFFAEVAAGAGFAVETPWFECLAWRKGGAHLRLGDVAFEARVSPFSLGVAARAPLAVASTVEELEGLTATGKVLLLRGEIAKEQLMPKNFPFYNPEEHRKIIDLLERQQPLAIVAATAQNPEMAGAVYPFPLFEDGDFDIPSVYTTEEVGNLLATHVGDEVVLEIRAERSQAQACNVVARKGNPERRVALLAHIDAKDGTPGAIDNAAGTVTLLLLAELLADYAGDLGVEIVAMNGEDYYSNPGEQLYLRLNAGLFEQIVLGVNLDGVGYVKGKTAYSLYNCPAELEQSIQRAFSAYPGLAQGEPWYQGDHGLFLFNQRPALAITSELVMELEQNFVHSAQDTPEIVDPARLAEAARALHELIVSLPGWL